MARLDELLVAEGVLLVCDESSEGSAVFVLECSLSVNLGSLQASSEELGPLVLDTEGVKLCVYLVLGDACQVSHYI